MSFDENTLTTNVGSRDWLEASKSIEIRGYLPLEGTVDITVESLDESTQFTAAGYEILVPENDESNPSHREDFDRLLKGMASSSE